MTKHEEKRLEKATQKAVHKPNTDGVSLKIKIISILFLVIMVLSLVSFALLSSPQSLNSQGGDVNEEGIPESMAFQEIQQQGETFYIAIEDHKIFEFQNPSTYQSFTDMEELSKELGSKSQVEIYQDESFDNSNAIYLIERYLSAKEVQHSKVQQESCNDNTLYLTSKEENLPQDCMVISAPEGEEKLKVEALLYYLFKE